MGPGSFWRQAPISGLAIIPSSSLIAAWRCETGLSKTFAEGWPSGVTAR